MLCAMKQTFRISTFLDRRIKLRAYNRHSRHSQLSSWRIRMRVTSLDFSKVRSYLKFTNSIGSLITCTDYLSIMVFSFSLSSDQSFVIKDLVGLLMNVSFGVLQVSVLGPSQVALFSVAFAINEHKPCKMSRWPNLCLHTFLKVP